ncbi:signal peptidase I [Nocardiopsis arvandica]|uniref:Signal peptidase I n=1 Tax=Nocardiopsis sinuspersici TaxID=501010 RepID=A0A7Y9XFN6_9ACTN|nr:signal peptidase I [Nocardiopsis sinuspersici]NYH53683.1 signal peptidase I [Nocardiopsis sinuspersici]
MSKDERDLGADGAQDEDSARSGPEERSSATGSREHELSGASGVSEAGGQEPEEKADTQMSKSQSSEKQGSFWKELPILVVIALVLAFVIRTWLVQAFYIPSSSMENTLLIGDRVLVNKVVYQIRDIERGEVVVFDGNGSWDDPSTVSVPEPTNPVSGAFTWVQQQLGAAPTGKEYIKRVIGLPGDTVECCDEQNRVLVNGVPLEEGDYLYPGSTASHTEFGPVKVPEGHLWLMGDHRAISADSRVNQNNPGDGAVPIDHVVGRAFVIIWPFSQAGWLEVPETFEKLNAEDG